MTIDSLPCYGFLEWHYLAEWCHQWTMKRIEIGIRCIPGSSFHWKDMLCRNLYNDNTWSGYLKRVNNFKSVLFFVWFWSDLKSGLEWLWTAGRKHQRPGDLERFENYQGCYYCLWKATPAQLFGFNFTYRSQLARVSRPYASDAIFLLGKDSYFGQNQNISNFGQEYAKRKFENSKLQNFLRSTARFCLLNNS